MGGPEVHHRRAAGVEMIVAIDSTVRGPALGGCRWRAYSDLDSARADAEALAAAMTRKAALARLALGGGKAVVAGDPAQRTREQLLAFGDLVESLGGRYITAADMGTGAEEMAVIGTRTRHVVGLPGDRGGCGDPGPWTARGVRMAIEVAAREIGKPLEALHVAVQGAGSVGAVLIAELLAAGARVSAADTDPAAVARVANAAGPGRLREVGPDEVLELDCDVLAPCGPPGVIGAERVDALRCRVICGAANNPLRDDAVAAQLTRRGILYVPDYLANAGGLIHLAVALDGGDAAGTECALRVIPENLLEVLDRSKASGLDTLAATRQILDSIGVS